ncbi:MAG TPA: S41 family peptidase [Anaeromyxobacteraceae bacterium]|nr:S41 family peptidase [Anaeromyxobacteraceae bacterium]
MLILLPLAAALALSAGAPAAPSPAAQAGPAVGAAELEALVRAISAKLREAYVFPEVGERAAAELTRRWRAGAYRALGPPEAVASQLSAELLELTRDRHLTLEAAPPRPAGPPETAEARQRRYQAFQRRVARDHRGVPRVEVLPGNVGYLAVTGFPDADLAGPAYAAAFAFLADAEALILDLRQNMGGDPAAAALLVSYLLPAPSVLVNRVRNRDGTEAQFWSSPSLPGPRVLDRPVWVLTSRETPSAAEEVAYDLQALKRATVVGEVTWGGANPAADHRVGERFVLAVPFGQAVNPVTGKNWEGTGVAPDVAVPAAEAPRRARQEALRALLAREADPAWRGELEAALAALAAGEPAR